MTYKVGIDIEAHNAVSPVLALLSREFIGLNYHVSHLIEKFSSMGVAQKSLFGAGIVGAVAGGAILAMANHIEKAGEKLVHAQVMFKSALPALSRASDIAFISQQATIEAGKNFNTTISGNIEAMHDLYNIVNDVGEAAKLLPAFNTLSTVAAAAQNKGFEVGSATDTNQKGSFARGIELSGRVTEEAASKAAKDLLPMMIALRGRITGESFLHNIKTSADARYGWNNDFLTKGLPAYINSGLGDRTGAVLYQANNNMWGGVKSSNLQADFQEKWGLHKKEDEIHDAYNKFQGFKPGSMWEADTFRQNPLEWANKFKEHLKEQGVDTNDSKQMQLVAAEIGRGNKFLKQFLDESLIPQTNAQLNKHVGNINKVGDDAVSLINDEDPTTVLRQNQAQLQNVMESLGAALVPLKIGLLQTLNPILSAISQFAMANPGTISAIGKALVILGSSLLVGGLIAFTVAVAAMLGPIGLAVAAVAGLAAAFFLFKDNLKALSPEAFKTLGASMGHFGGMMKGVWHAVQGLFTLDFGKMMKGFSEIGTNFQKFDKELTDGLLKMLSDAWAAISPKLAKFGSDISTAISDAIPTASQVIGIMKGLGNAILAGISSAVDYVKGKAASLFSFGGGAPAAPAGARALGGPVRSGSSYLVGERGPELFVPSNHGYIEPNNRIARLSASASRSPNASGQAFEINNVMHLDGEVVHRSVERRMVAKSLFPTSAPHFDGELAWASPDMQFSTG